MSNTEVIEPQEGPQTAFIESNADIVIYGGMAGGGKTFALLLDPVRYFHIPDFGAVIFRRTIPMLKNEGGIFDESMKLYPKIKGKPNMSELYWKFPSGATLSMGGMEHEKDMFNYQGAQIPWIGFDELTHFTRRQFFYMFSRNRSTCGVKPQIRATTNPEKKSWVRGLIQWWLYPKDKSPTGRATPIPERSGVIRYFIVENDQLIWKDKREDFENPQDAKSFTFIAASVYDNKILLEKDPGYLANLKALPKVERDKLLGGDWDAEEAPREVFRKEWFKIIKIAPMTGVQATIRYWDRAASENETSDWTVGLKVAHMKNGSFVILDMVRFRGSPAKVEERIKNVAAIDKVNCIIGIEEDPGSAGKSEAHYLVTKLAGYNVRTNRATKDKLTRALPASAQAEVGNIFILEAHWNDEFFTELESFPVGAHDDIVDTLSGAFSMLIQNPVGEFTERMSQSEVREQLREW